jgi:carboxyl-terminal processing protease
MHIVVILALLAVGGTSHATPPRENKREGINRTLVGTKKTRLRNGLYLRQQKWRWTLPGHPRGTSPSARVHERGRVKVIRRYTPRSNSTLVEQLVVIRPVKQPRTDAEYAEFARDHLQRKIEKLSLAPVDRAELARGAMRGMMGVFDRHSMYFSPDQWDQFDKQSQGTEVGVGIALPTRGTLRVEKCPRSSPGYRAGVRRGDRLLAVDGKPVKTFDEAYPLVTGVAGSKVRLTISRASKTIEVEVTRAAFNSNPVRSRLTPDGLGYLRLNEFTEGAASDVQKSLAKLERRNRGPLRGLVLDLRNNPGGMLLEALTLLNQFVPRGTLVTLRGRDGELQETHRADPARASHPKLPLAVLINRNSASASELVSGALRDHGRALLLGEQSHGKGTTQSALMLEDGSGIKITTARYHLPGGATPDGAGITPDVSTAEARRLVRARAKGRPRVADYLAEEAFARLRASSTGEP